MSNANKVYIGNLNPRATERDIEDEFGRFGKLTNVWVARKPPGFAFIEYDDRRDGEDAIRAMDKKRFFGQEIRVEFSRTESGPRKRFDGPYSGPGDSARDDRDRDRDRDDRGRGGDRDDRRGDDRSYRRSPSPRRGASPPPTRGRDQSRSP